MANFSAAFTISATYKPAGTPVGETLMEQGFVAVKVSSTDRQYGSYISFTDYPPREAVQELVNSVLDEMVTKGIIEYVAQEAIDDCGAETAKATD